MSTTRKFLRGMDKVTLSNIGKATKLQKVVSTVTALGFVLQPMAALASTITRADGTPVTVGNDGVANVWAGEVINKNAAVNIFQKFDVSAGHIANMYFKTEGGSTEADNLINFVTSRIDINGTVNAIHNSKIGGNLFFLSSDGMAVGKTGVINAGNLYVATPNLNKLKQITDNIQANIDANTKIEDALFYSIPINSSGTITVLGKINAAGNVQMRAPKIGIGKNVSGDEAYDVHQGGTSASIKTGVTDFSNIVNIKDASGNKIVDAGLGNNLQARVDTNGDIVLSAYNSYNDNYYGIASDALKLQGKDVNAELVVAQGAEINAAGKAQLSATAVNNVVMDQYNNPKDAKGNFTNSHLVGQIVDTKANVSIDGKVTAKRVDISANAANCYISSEGIKLTDITDKLSLVGIGLDASYGKLESEATVNVGENAVINATGSDVVSQPDKDGNTTTEKALSITANSTVDLEVGAGAGGLQLVKMSGTALIPAAGVAYAESKNKAEVTINGALASAGSTEIAAKADSTISATATTSGGNNLAAVALTIADGSNSSKVTIGQNAKMADGNLKGDVSIKATSTNSITTEADVSTQDDSVAATAINVTEHNSSADVVINGSVSSKGKLDIGAENLVTENNVTADNAMGSSAFTEKIGKYVTDSQTLGTVTGQGGVIDKVKAGVTNFEYTPEWLKKIINNNDPAKEYPWDNVKDLFSAGASVGVANESNTAGVAIGQGVKLAAGDDLSIKANSIIQDTHMNVTGSSKNSTDAGKKQAMVNAAVLYTNLQNDATVTVAGGEEAANGSAATNVQLSGKNVDVQANSAFEYNRINRMIDEVLQACKDVENAYTDDTTQGVKDKFTALKNAADKFLTLAKANGYKFDDLVLTEEFKNFIIAANNVKEAGSEIGDQFKDVFVGPLSVVGAAAKFADPTNYVNFSAGAANKGKSSPEQEIGGNTGKAAANQNGGQGGTQGAAKVSVAGSATITNLANNAKVLIGKNAVINATEKADLKATSKQTDVALTGKLGLNGGGDTAVGGTIGLGFADANSLVVVAKGAKVTAGDITMQAENAIKHTNIAIGAGKSGSAGITGMVSYLSGDSNSIVSVDDEAVLAATVNSANNTTGKIKINAVNDTDVISIAGAVALGETAGAGASVAITDFDRYNYAAITDNGYAAPTNNSSTHSSDAADAADTSDAGGTTTDENEAAPIGEDANADRSKNADKLTSIADTKLSKLQQLVQDKSGLASDKQDAFFGAKTAKGSKGESLSTGSITASGLDVSATTTGDIVNVTVAGGVSTGDDSGEPGIGDKISTFITNKSNAAQNKANALDNKLAGKLNGLLGRATEAQKVLPTDAKPNVKTTKQKGFTIAGAGSASVNLLEGDTAAIIDGAKIKINNTDAQGENVSVSASDSAMVVAASGAAGVSWKNLSKSQNANSTNVAFAGAVGVNDVDSATLAVIRKSKIDDADAIINNAQKSGAVVAAGVGLALSKNSAGNNGGTNVAASVNASVNMADNTVYALMQENEVKNDNSKTSITNSAFDNDIQITGGISSSVSIGGNNAFVCGATVAYGSLKNDVQSALIGGKYENISTADVTAKTNMTQVGVAVNASVAGGADTSYSFGGTAAYNKLDNYANATVDGLTFSGQSLDVAAYDTNETANEHQEDIKKRGFDADEYLKEVQGAANENGDSGKTDENGNVVDEGSPKVDITRKGNVIVTGATSVGVTTGSDGGSAGASLAISDIDNDFNASIKGSNITTGVDTQVKADSNTILAGFAAGVAGSNGQFGIGGSANWQTLNNDITASIENSTVQAPKTDVIAKSGALAVNVAGQIGVTTGSKSKLGAGMALAYNSLNNTTGAYVKGSEISNEDGKDAELNVSAANKGNVYSIGAAVTAGTGNALNGVVVVNKGKNDVEAVISDDNNKRSKLTNMSKVNVNSSDDSNQLAVIGNVSVAAGSSAKAALGGSIAINDIGALAGGKQSNTAAIRNTDITTTDNGEVTVNAVDESTLTTISAGVAVTTGSFAFSGAGSAALIEKETKAELNNTKVNADSTAKGKVKAAASGTAKITTVGIMGAGAKDAAIGLGIAVNKINADTKTTINEGEYKVNDFIASSDSVAKLTSVGISAAGAKNAGLAGNVTVNMIGNNTQTTIKDAKITANNNIAALATSSEELKNYAGALGVAAGGQLGIGMSVAYNEITGNTESVVDGATLNAAGNGSALGEAVSEQHKDSKGIIVAADAEHELDNVLVTAGVAASSDAAVGVAGTVAVNHLAGATNAKLNNSTANTVGTAGDVSVIAKDTTDVDSTVGAVSAAVGADAGVAFGAASDTNLLSRNVTAEIDGGDNQKTFNANKLTVDAQSENKTKTTAIGAAAAVAGYGSAGVAGTVSVTKSDATTLARVNNISGNNIGMTINAKRSNNIELAGSSIAAAGGMGAGAAGISVGVLSDDSHTEAKLTKAKITHNNTYTAEDKIHAENTTTVNTGISAASAAIAIGGAAAGAVGVNNFNNTVKTSVDSSEITGANTITIDADNTLSTEFISSSAAGGLVGGSLGVGVNTIDTSVVTEVNKSKLQAQNITVAADETRDITQTAINAAVGGVALGANVLVTNIGSAVQGTYTTENKDTIDVDGTNDNGKHYAMADADDAVSEQNSINSNAYKNFVKKYKAEDSSAAKAVDKVGRGGSTEAKGVQVKISGSSEITAGTKADIKANTETNTNITAGGVAVGGTAASGTFSVLNVKRNSGVTVENSKIAAKEIAIASKQAGTANMNIYQGVGGMTGINVAVGVANLSGANKVTLNGATLSDSDKVDIQAEDASQVNVNAIGVTVGAVSLGSITAVAGNESTNDIVVEKSNVSSNNTIDVVADKHNTVTAHATGGSAGMVSGSAIVAVAKDDGTSSITLGKANDTSKKNKFSAKTLTVNAKASPAVKALADSAAVALTYGASAAVATATAKGGANVIVNNGDELLVDEVNLQADIYAQDGKKNVEAKAEGNSGGGLVNVGANVATATTNTTANVTVGAIKGKTKEVVTGSKTVYDKDGKATVTNTKKTVGTTALNITSNNSTTTFADARGVNIGGIFSSGNNVAKTNNTSTTTATMNVGSSELLLGKLNVTASGAGDNLTTADGSGGGLVSADLAAYVENRMNANTTTTVNGKLNVNGEVTINAMQNDRANLNADALKATVVGASATKADNKIEGTTKVDVNGLTLTGADNLNVNADNTVTVGDSKKYAVQGSGYGGVNVQGAMLDNKVDKKATINIGNAKLTTDGAQGYEAKTTANITAGGYIKAAGVGALTWIDVDNNVKAEDSITVGSSAKLKTTKAEKNITLAAVDNMTINAIGVADTQVGAAGGASSDVTNKTIRNNSITVANNAELYSMNDVNLYAGRDLNGADGKLKLTVDSEAYNKTALGLGKPKLKDEIEQNNNVTMNTGSKASSVSNINLYADAGQETIRDTSVMYNWYYSDKDENYTSSTIGDNEPQNKKSNNFVQADGTLTAGVQNKQIITIGTDGTLVFLDKNIRDGVNKVSGNNAIGEAELRNKITVSDGINKDDIVLGTMDYGTTLFERYEQLGKLMKEYSEDTSSTAYLGYKAEMERIFTEMKTMGLVEEIKGNDGKSYYAPIKGATIDYISLPDIVASGGNINITTDTLAGTGSMEAKGAPEVEINNNTNLYMKINNVSVGDAGGEINYNGVGLKSTDYNKTINELNVKKDKTANFSKVAPTAETGNGGKITINGNYGGSYVQAKATIEGKEETIETKPKADIEINGYVNAKNGSVNITSLKNNIIIQGTTADSSAGVSGSEVHLSAASGSVSQGYTDGITSIGGNVQNQYQSKYNDLKKQFDDTYGYEYTKDINGEVKTSEKASDLTGNMIVGENIYINAADININGYMQSGYADYEVTITDAVAADIDRIKNGYKGGSLSDAVVTTGDKYRVIKGEDVLDSGSYKRQLDVYYNPSTGKLVVPDVDANGGKIYLTGRISSTGGGKINALDGAYDIKINNNTDNTLQVGRLVSNKSEGLISITDTGRGKLTEITRSGAKEYDIKDVNKENGTTVSNSQYKPEEGLRYNWTTGQNVSTSKTYQNTIKAGLWGAVETMDKTKLTEFEQNNEPISEGDKKTNPKLNGEYIGTVNNNTVNGSDFSVIYDNKVLKDTQIGPGEPERWSSGFMGWFKWERYTWTRETGTSQQYVASVKADNIINVGFIGKNEGNINVTSNGSLDVAGKLASTAGGSINLTSNNGSISQNAVNMVSDNVSLNAKTGINNIGITSVGDTVNVSAINGSYVNNNLSGSGNIDIKVAGAYGKKGNVLVGSIVNYGNDEVHLTADGNINQAQSTTGASIVGKRIDLISNNGAIGNNGTLKIKAGTEVVDPTDSLSASINATAKDNINLTQTEGDMRVGQIKSAQGDVTITVADGNLVDALPDGEVIDRGDTEALIQKWKDLGLIAGDGSYTAKQQQDVEDYKANVKDEFARYKELKAYYEDKDNKFTQAETNAYESYKNARAAYDSFTNEFKDYQNQTIYYADDKNIPQKTGYRTEADYNKALDAYNTGKAAYNELKTKCAGSTTAEAYAQSKMTADAWNSYNEPKVGEKDMKSAFGSYDSYQDLQARYNGFADADAYLNSAAAQKHINELTDTNRSWTENQLLYAIQDSIINPTAGSGDNISKNPNLMGKNITVNATKGSVGLDSNNVEEINLAGISDRVADLKKLVNASASTVKWDKANGKATITPKNPLGMQLTDANGRITVTAKDNVYISGRKDETAANDNPLNIDTIKTDGNVRLQSNVGIYNLHNGEGAAISGKDLLIQGGELGGVGKADKLMTINTTGKITATGKQGVYLEQVGDSALQITSVTANGDIVLKAKGDILSADEEGTSAQGYINNEGSTGTITINAGGSAGSAEHKLRIKNADDANNNKVISVTAGKDVYLQGISTTIADNAEPNGTMFIKSIEAKGVVDVAANGNLNIKGAVNNNASSNITLAAEKSIEVNAGITNAEKGAFKDNANIILSARNNVNLNENAVLQAKKVNLVASAVRNTGEAAAEGKITQNANSQIITDKVVAAAMNGIDLSSAKNTFKTVDVANMGAGAINIANDGTHDLTVIIAHENNGDITVHNYQKADTTSNMKVESQVEADGTVNYINDAGSITLPDADTFTSEAEKFGTDKTYNNIVNNVKRAITATNNVNIVAKNGSVTNSANIDSDKDVVIKNETGTGDVVNTGNVKGLSVTMTTVNGNITSDGTLRSTSGDVTANTNSGNIGLNGDVTSAKDVILTTAAGSITTKGVIKANRQVKANATTGITAEKSITAGTDLVIKNTAEGSINTAAITGKNITVTNENGLIAINGAADANDGDVTLEAKGENGSITTNDTVHAKNNVKETAKTNITAEKGITADTGDVVLTGNGKVWTKDTVTATAGNVSLKSNNSDVQADKAISAGAKAELSAAAGSITTNGTVTTNNDITYNAETGITAKGAITSNNGNATLNNISNDITTAAITAQNVSLKNQTGNVLMKGAVKADNANGTLSVRVEQQGDITAEDTLSGKVIDLYTKNGKIKTVGDVTATADVDLKAETGSIETGNVKAANNVNANATGDIKATGNIEATAGNATINSSNASVSTKDVTAGKNVDIDAGASITTEGTVKATTGNVSYDAKTGITANGSVTAGTDVSMKTTTGNITAGSTVTAGNDASFNVDENGNITTNGNVTANKDITYDAKGSITTGGSINSTLGNIKLTTNAANGDMTFGGNVKADNGNIGITAKENGNLQFNGNVITDYGNIDIIVEGNGNILDNDKLFSATGEKGDKATGNIKLQIKGAGDVDLNEIFATNDASVDVANGNLTLAKIDGNLVAIQLRTEGKEMKVKDIIAGTKIVAKGSNMDLDKIKQRLDADGMLTIVPDGAKDDAPIDNLRIGEIATNTGVRFEHLWLNNGSINVSEGKFHIDKLVVNDNAHFSNAHMTTAVWGNPPQRDHSDSVFWNNTAVNNPKDNLSEWQAENGTNAEKWMYLHFTEIPNIQRSNGVLLDLRNYDYVYNQRFTAVDHLNQLLAENKADEYDINFKPEVVRYFRYDLYDLEQEAEENAAPEEVIVEA